MGYENSVCQCYICKLVIHKDDKFYEQKLVKNEKIIFVILCEDCMTELQKCPECGLARPYCNDCV